MKYIPTTNEEVRHMLDAIGIESIDELFADIPPDLRFEGELNLPPALYEAELLRHGKKLADLNQNVADDLVCFMGGGAYDHLTPAALRTVLSRSEFYTAYTPYQAELTQGVLQSIFEFQTMICQITGMDVANASVYEGASALAEGAIMACAHTGRGRVLISETCHPEYRLVVETYLRHQGIQVDTVPQDEGIVDIEALKDALDKDVACVLMQHPNVYGCLEPVAEASDAVHEVNGLFVVSVDPISLGLLEPPAAYGADIAVGEGQPLGNSLSFGGPYLGFLAAKQELVRRIPGRVAGETVDVEGRRGFVLTLQTREQHIRRERATSNICTNQALNALAAAAYLAFVGKEGFKEVAYLSFQKAHYTQKALLATGKARPMWDRPFFKEFAISCDVSPEDLQAHLLSEGFLVGPTFNRLGLSPADGLLVCATEARSKEEIDRFAAAFASA